MNTVLPIFYGLAFAGVAHLAGVHQGRWHYWALLLLFVTFPFALKVTI